MLMRSIISRTLSFPSHSCWVSVHSQQRLSASVLVHHWHSSAAPRRPRRPKSCPNVAGDPALTSLGPVPDRWSAWCVLAGRADCHSSPADFSDPAQVASLHPNFRQPSLASHLTKATSSAITNGEYVDFATLLPAFTHDLPSHRHHPFPSQS